MSHQDSRLLAAELADRIERAFEAHGVKLQGKEQKIAKAAAAIFKRLEKTIGASNEKLYKALGGNLCAIEGKFTQNLQWTETYGVTAEKWADACLRHAPLFTMSPRTLQNKFRDLSCVFQGSFDSPSKYMDSLLHYPQQLTRDVQRLSLNAAGHVAWTSLYGYDDAAWSNVVAHAPSYIGRTPEQLRFDFELALALAESEACNPVARDDEFGFRQMRVNRLFASPMRSTDDIALRMMYVELEKPVLRMAILRDTRGKIEQMLLESLGVFLFPVRDAPKKIPVADSALRSTIEATKKQIVDHLRTLPEPHGPRGWGCGFLPVLCEGWGGDNASAEQKKNVAHSLARAGMLRHFTAEAG